MWRDMFVYRSMEDRNRHKLLAVGLIFSLLLSGDWCALGDPGVLEPTTQETPVIEEPDSVTKESPAVEESNSLPNETPLQAEEPAIPHQAASLGPKIIDWDAQRAEWLDQNPHFRLTRAGRPRVILATSSQSEPCASASGDHFLLKSLKNKIDYARLHDIEIYYNMVLMEKEWTDFWIKIPIVRKLMLTHPEAEWIWWMDSDAMFTDMSFEIPFEKYKDHNMIVHGWDGQVYENKNWVGLNAGIYLLRNCQWSLDLMDVWAAMGEDYDDNRQKMGDFLADNLINRPHFISDDQSALVYLLSISKTDELKPKVYLETSYALHGYWVWVMGKLETMLNESSPGAGGDEWPFITHFVGCKPCSGSYPSYDLDLCVAEMDRAFNLADNQVLQMYGFEHDDLSSTSVKRIKDDSLRPLDYLGKSPLEFVRQNPWLSSARRLNHLPQRIS